MTIVEKLVGPRIFSTVIEIHSPPVKQVRYLRKGKSEKHPVVHFYFSLM